MNFFSDKTRFFLITVTIIMIIAMALSTLPFNHAGLIENVFGIVISPFQKITDFLVESTEGFFSFIINIKDTQKRNGELKEEISVLNSDLRELSDLKTENEKLRSLLELKNNDTNYDTVAAEIISRSWNNWENTVTVNKGSQNGIKINNPVITETGVVGYVYEVGTNWAKIMTILDPSSSVSSIASRTGDDGIIQGDYSIGSRQYCKMSFIGKESGISNGDSIETSGAGGIYPAGLYIGRVTDVKAVSDGVSRQAVIEPGVNFNDLKYVLIIR